MKVWARKVLMSDYSNGKTWAYMDKVGIMHTGVSPFKLVFCAVFDQAWV